MTRPSARTPSSAPGIWWTPNGVELKTADVTIKVNPDRSDLVQTRVLNGVKYILVRVEEGVELNGVPVQIQE